MVEEFEGALDVEHELFPFKSLSVLTITMRNRPVCKHCQDFKLTCVYADGKRDRFKKYAEILGASSFYSAS